MWEDIKKQEGITKKQKRMQQKECETWHDWMEKVMNGGELCKKLKFDHTNKWYMHNP